MTQDPNARTIDTYNKIAKEYVQKSLKSNWIVSELEKFIDKLPEKAKVLEVGCGSGRDAKYLYDQGIEVLATDYTDAFLQEVNKRFPELNTEKVDMRNLPYQENQFDGLIANASLLHIETKDVPKTLRGFNKVLKYNGVLMMLVKQGSGEEFVKEARSLGKERFYTYFQKDELEKLLVETGFRIEESYTFPESERRDNSRDLTWIVVFARKT